MRRKTLGVVVGAAALLGAVAPLATPARAESEGATNVSASVSEGAAERAAAYWTPERMRRAKPADMAHRGSTGGEGAPEGARGAQVSVAPAAAAGATAGTEAAAEGSAEHALQVPRPYTNYPDKLNGKVFFTKAVGGNFVCSGVVINSTSKRLVHTAGHCVSDGAGRFHKNWVFVPAYSSSSNGHRPFGTWTARTLTTRTEWHNFSNFKQDLGIAVMNDLNGKRIVNALGGQGGLWNASRNQQWRDFGYPQASPFNGFLQWECRSGRLADDNPSSRSGPLTIRIHCNMTGGSSGGGWLVNVGSSGLGHVNGVNSYRYISGSKANPDHMYGPYFGSEAKSLYDFANSLG